jgi:hypothetical protein
MSFQKFKTFFIRIRREATNLVQILLKPSYPELRELILGLTALLAEEVVSVVEEVDTVTEDMASVT